MPKKLQPHSAARSRHGRPIHAAGAMQLELIQGDGTNPPHFN
jgi:hypothetical protein